MVERVIVGQQLGRYRLDRHIGQGNLADVYLGKDTTSEKLVAIKVLHTALAAEDVDAFFIQAEFLTRLQHPHIVRVLEFGLEEQLPYVVMEYAPHGTLRDIHPAGTRLPLSTVVAYVRQIADALHYVHEQQIIHRDIKPHNVLLDENYDILLSDFSIAVIAQNAGYRKQKVQDFEGTILYAAPEQLRGKPRIGSDQYALGVVVYEWLAGRCPFYGTVEEIAQQHMLVPPPSLQKSVQGISAAVEQVVLKALSKNIADRFASIKEFATALERASRLETPLSPHPLAPLLPLPLKAVMDEDLLPPAQTAHVIYQGHRDKVHMLAWSPDGKLIASSSLDETLQIWLSNTGNHILTYHNNVLQPQVLAWSPDGTYLASTGGLLSETVQVWEALSGRISTRHATYHGHSETINALAWSLDGKYIASASDDRTVQVWEALSGRTIFTYRGHVHAVKALAWSRNAGHGGPERIASSGEDKVIHVWNAPTGGDTVIYYGHTNKVNAVIWSPGGTHLASGGDDSTVQVWDASSGRKVLVYSGHSGAVTGVSWAQDGIRLASSSLDETVQVWNALTGNVITTYRGHSDWVSTVAWSPDGKKLASGSWDKTIHIWDA
jgi:serine/threonine protein kinase